MSTSLQHYLACFAKDKYNKSLSGFGRGIEREALRVNDDATLANTPHNVKLGSALTHPYITTDYAETLLEFITPVSHSVSTSLAQLKDVQKYTLANIGDELLWPLSIPCYVDDEDKIELAQYGHSNIGRMKTTYRQGLKNRYGSMMQIISGIHFNFSFSSEFWQSLKEIDDDKRDDKSYISDKYFALIRNYKRYGWLIPYLYGASPAMCPSFLQGKESHLPFETLPSGAIYLPYATSLRMSDLGYTNSAQSSLNICYNDLETYVKGVKEAINLPSDEFAKIGIKVDDEYRQLNSNILQIENELYAPIRPKQVAKSGEKPSEALTNRGVEYIEVRALDVNPFASTGITEQQIYFLDVFLTFCMFAGYDSLDCGVQKSYEDNINKVILEGRKPGLTLNDACVEKTIPQWGDELFSQFEQIAVLLDKAYETDRYCNAISVERDKINNPDKTPSAKLIEVLKQSEGISAFAMAQARAFKSELANHEYQHFSAAALIDEANASLQRQAEIEASDQVSFDEFLDTYFQR